MIVGDWGTTRLRLFRSSTPNSDKIVGPGIGQLRGSPAQTLIAMIEPWAKAARQTGVLLCGMAGSRNGLAEVRYAECPAGYAEWAANTLTVEGMPFDVRIASGLQTTNLAGLPDVMRGEETQVFGLLSLDPSLATGRHVIVLPGTHSKWALVEEGRVTTFHTFPTGELFALLRDHSTLVRAGSDYADQEAGFAAGLERGEAGAFAGLFAARAAQLVEGRSHGWALGYISGLLIGGELSEARRLVDGPMDRIIVVGDPSLSSLYRQAGEALGMEVILYDGDACVLAGLGRLAAEIGKVGA